MTEPTTRAAAPGQRLGEREVLVLDPCVVQVYERIVYHVQGVRYVAQELAYPRRRLVRRLARGSEINDQREDRGGASGVVQPVHPQVLAAADPGHGRYRDDSQSAYPESSPDTDGLEYRATSAARPRTRTAGARSRRLCSLPSGRSRRRCRRAVPIRRTRSGRSREQDQRGQSPSGKSAEEKRVENVAYVFEEQRPARGR